MSTDRILDKIKKCLALARSSNPHEAEAAMRQAQKLMQAHGIDAHAVTASEVGETAVKSQTMARDMMAKWECLLASEVGKAFGCQMLISRSLVPDDLVIRGRKPIINEGSFIYIGLKHQAEVAAYTAQVLIRRCKKARAEFIADKLGHITGLKGGRKKATELGDAFATGWVLQVTKTVQAFANPEGIDAAIADHVTKRGARGTVEGRGDLKGTGASAAATLGAQAAKGESLHRPMGQADRGLALGHNNQGVQP